MLELILGKDWTENTEYALSLIADDVRKRKENRILLVPELISHDMERRLCSAAGDTASRYAEVLTFTRLARRIAEYSACDIQECLDNGGRMVVMAAAARQLHGQLKVYASLETKPEFLAQLLDAIDEFKRCCISPKDLRTASGLSEGVLAQKLEELSLLLEAYDALCQRGKRDPRDQMNWVLEQLEDSDFAQNHIFYIDGFPDFTRQHMAVLEHMIRNSDKVIVSLNCDAPSSKGLAFEKAGQTAAQLIKLSQKAGVEVKITQISSGRCLLAPVRDHLFQGKVVVHPGLADRLSVFRADTVYRECQIVAEAVLKLIHSGYRYRDISIVCTDMNTYRPVIGMIFRRHRIPVYLSGTDDILGKGPILTVLAALEAALEGFDQQAMLRYLRSPLSPIGQQTCDRVENYVHIWGITGKRWLEPWTAHPDGLISERSEWAQKRLDELEMVRIKVIEPLARLRDCFKNSISIAMQVQGLYAFLDEIEFAKRLAKLSDEFDRAGDNRNAQILNQLWDVLVNAMEQLYDVLGETHWDDNAFLRLFVLLLSQYDVGTIPTVLDSVTAGPVSAMRCQQEKHLFVLGGSEGLLPGYSGSNGVLTDQERVALRKMEVPLTGGALEGIQAEFAEVYGVFCGAQETVTVSCSGSQPSYVYRRLTGLVGGEMEITPVLGYAGTDPTAAAALLLQHEDRKAAESLHLEEIYNRVSAQRDHTLGAVSREHIEGIYGKCLDLSASQVNTQAECRLSYFLRYGIKAKEIKEATVDPAEYGTYVHDVLENTVREVINRGGFHKVTIDETLALAKEYSDIYTKQHFSELESQRVEYLFRRNTEELNLVVAELWDELHEAGYEPVAVEWGFEDGEDMPKINIPSTSMEAKLRGYIDRVDHYQIGDANYIRVVDYKTGSKDFDYCDVFNGVGLQMLLYLFALDQEDTGKFGKHPIPGGVQYFPARVPYVNLDGADEDETTERRKSWRRNGLLLDDDLSLAAMDPDGTMSRLCCTKKKDGTLSGDIASMDQLKQLKQYVFMILAGMVEEISSGIVEPNPYTRGSSHNACAFCPYQSVCHMDSVAGRRNYKAMTSQRFWEEIAKVVHSRG